jgi:hypothetical protein
VAFDYTLRSGLLVHRVIIQDKKFGSCALNKGHSHRTVSRVYPRTQHLQQGIAHCTYGNTVLDNICARLRVHTAAKGDLRVIGKTFLTFLMHKHFNIPHQLERSLRL